MGAKDTDNDDGGFPADVFEQMRAGHDKFMRELQDEGRRFQQDLEKETSTKPSSSPSSSGNNFFLSFKDFVDTNLSNLAESFKSFPSNIAELRTKMQEEAERRKQEERDVWTAWTGIEDQSRDHCQMLSDRATPEARQQAVDAAIMLLKEARNRNAHIPPNKIVGLFSDNMRSYEEIDRYTWLSVDWFKRSPYSPISLERHANLQQAGDKWRAAFEDLVSAALDKPMSSREQVGQRIPQGRPQSTRFGPGLDWMLSLQCRGILPPQFPQLYSTHKTWLGTLPGISDERLEYMANNNQSAELRQLIDEIATPAPTADLDDMPADLQTEQEMYDQHYQLLEVERAQNLQNLAALREAPQCPLQAANATSPQAILARDEGPDENALNLKQFDRLSQQEKQEYAELMIRGDELAGQNLNWPALPTLEQLQDVVERLEQEQDALGLSPPYREAGFPALLEQVEEEKQTERESRSLQGGNAGKKVDVLSSLTTTHTTRLPDGTVTTKVVLKQRFADGREEMEEKIHTYQESRAGQDRHVEQAEEKPKQKGWFWS